MPARDLPQPPYLDSPKTVGRVRAAFDALYLSDTRAFAAVFSEPSGTEEICPQWRENVKHLEQLSAAGILKITGDRIRSKYLVTHWAKAFYLSDFPDCQHDSEVFSPHPETFAFLNLFQVRPGDSVLDLGSGNGILLLEAARRGARGIGIDKSPRAVMFAQANALLNGLEERVKFACGDMAACRQTEHWGSPTVVLCNPPFEPVPDDPGFPRRPLHSHGGPYGTEVIDETFAVLRAWRHRPAVLHFILFSLGKGLRERGCDGDHLRVWNPLERLADELRASLELREVIRPIRVEDYLILNFENDCQRGKRWLERMRDEEYHTLHLVFATLYPSEPVTAPPGCTDTLGSV